jgi:branched-subunit amino acid ABC-type transport system permease component
VSDLLPFVVTGLVTGSLYGLAGVGLVLTYRTSGVFNTGHGAVAAGGAFLFATLYDSWGLPWPLAGLLAIGAFALIGGPLLEWMTRAVADAPSALPLVVTSGLTLGIQGVLFWRYGNVSRTLPQFLPTSGFTVASVAVTWSQVIVVGVATVAALGLYAFLREARTGVAMRAVVDDPRLLALSGTDPVRVRRLAWSIGAAFAALSGVLLAPTLGLDATLLTLLVVQAFGACAVGRFANLPLTYVGGLLIGVLASVATRYLTDAPWDAVPSTVPFLVLVAVLLVTPTAALPVQGRPSVNSVVHDAPARRRGPVLVAVGSGVLALAAVPWLVGTYLSVWTAGLIAALLFASLGLLLWTSGQVSLCHAAFVAVGAASMGHLTQDLHLPWLLALLGAGLLAVPVGVLVAVPAIRLSGIYLALATLGFGFLLQTLAYPTFLLFGSGGTPLLVDRPQLGWLDGTDDKRFHLVVLAVVVVALAATAALLRQRLGRLLRAMADAPTMLSTHGVSANMTRLTVFTCSAFLAGLAGALQVAQFGSASSATFGPIQSLLYVAVLAIAGTSVLRGAVIAAGLFAVLPAYAASQDGLAFADDADRQILVFGIIAIAAGVRIARRGAIGARLRQALSDAGERPRVSRRPGRWREIPVPAEPG